MASFVTTPRRRAVATTAAAAAADSETLAFHSMMSRLEADATPLISNKRAGTPQIETRDDTSGESSLVSLPQCLTPHGAHNVNVSNNHNNSNHAMIDTTEAEQQRQLSRRAQLEAWRQSRRSSTSLSTVSTALHTYSNKSLSTVSASYHTARRHSTSLASRRTSSGSSQQQDSLLLSGTQRSSPLYNAHQSVATKSSKLLCKAQGNNSNATNHFPPPAELTTQRHRRRSSSFVAPDQRRKSTSEIAATEAAAESANPTRNSRRKTFATEPFSLVQQRNYSSTTNIKDVMQRLSAKNIAQRLHQQQQQQLENTPCTPAVPTLIACFCDNPEEPSPISIGSEGDDCFYFSADKILAPEATSRNENSVMSPLPTGNKSSGTSVESTIQCVFSSTGDASSDRTAVDASTDTFLENQEPGDKIFATMEEKGNRLSLLDGYEAGSDAAEPPQGCNSIDAALSLKQENGLEITSCSGAADTCDDEPIGAIVAEDDTLRRDPHSTTQYQAIDLYDTPNKHTKVSCESPATAEHLERSKEVAMFPAKADRDNPPLLSPTFEEDDDASSYQSVSKTCSERTIEDECPNLELALEIFKQNFENEWHNLQSPELTVDAAAAVGNRRQSLASLPSLQPEIFPLDSPISSFDDILRTEESQLVVPLPPSVTVQRRGRRRRRSSFGVSLESVGETGAVEVIINDAGDGNGEEDEELCVKSKASDNDLDTADDYQENSSDADAALDDNERNVVRAAAEERSEEENMQQFGDDSLDGDEMKPKHWLSTTTEDRTLSTDDESPEWQDSTCQLSPIKVDGRTVLPTLREAPLENPRYRVDIEEHYRLLKENRKLQDRVAALQNDYESRIKPFNDLFDQVCLHSSDFTVTAPHFISYTSPSQSCSLLKQC
jgi:hypothetical protein